MAKTKVELQNYQGESLSPITIASNVLYEDGRNAQEVFEEYSNETFTPTIENSSSMFKVGQGDNVDYSSNVVNGAYEGMVLKGKSMVNCIQEPSSEDVVLPYEFEDGQYVTINDTKESGALGVELKGQTLANLAKKSTYKFSYHSDEASKYTFTSELNRVSITINEAISQWRYSLLDLRLNMLKPNTKYFVKFEGNFKGSVTIKAGDSSGALTNSVGIDNNNYVIITTNDLSSSIGGQGLFFYPATPNQYPHTYTLANVVLTEYQDGMENWDIPYFEGTQSVKMPILSTVGKNLINPSEFISNMTVYNINVARDGDCFTFNGESSGTYDAYITVQRNEFGQGILLRKNKTYCIGYEVLSGSVTGSMVLAFKCVNSSNSVTWKETSGEYLTYTPKEDIYVSWLRMHGYSSVNYDNFKIRVYIEEATSPTSYESYKTSILSLPEEVVLRSLPNGVRDTFNVRTGVYTQRIGEVVLNGSESWKAWESNDTHCKASLAHYPADMRINGEHTTRLICDKLKISSDRVGVVNDNFMASVGDAVYSIVVGLELSKLASADITGLKQWLSQNPLTVQYELATPIVTKISLSSTLKSWNTTTHIYSEIPENTLYPILSHPNPTYPVILKPSTKYSIVANSYSNNHTNSAINFNLGGATTSTTVGNRVTTVTTPSTLSNELLTMSGRGNKLNNVMVIEGDVIGDEPYFEGICDCKSPILSNVGKNLFDNIFTTGGWWNGVANNNPDLMRSVNLTPVKPNTTYIYNSNIEGHRQKANFMAHASDGSFIEYLGFGRTFTTPSNCHYIHLYTENDNSLIAQVEEGTVSTTIEPYKSNILSCETYFDETTQSDKTIVLRSLPSGACDTLNVETGEYVQRIGERTLNGSEDWDVWQQGGDHLARKTVVGFGLNLDDAPTTKNFYVLCDHFATGGTTSGANNDHTYYVYHKELIYGYYANASVHHRLGLSVSKTKLGIPNDNTNATQALAGLRTYLASNPVTVQYELATPIVSTIDVQGFPYAYTNGHVQLSSGSIEQSLTPKVEYSVATNRNGQIRSNQKMVERHQKQLDQLQAIILANMVNTQYQQTLTTLNYDLLKKEVGE